ncbi:MAG: response regulator transcription factor [Bacteroidota bacterium]
MNANTSESIGIVLIEDNIHLRDSWATILKFEHDFSILGTFSSVEEALQNSELQLADIILLDIQLPGMSGVDGIAAIHKINPHVPIVMATVNEDDDTIVTALRNGAIGYLSKRVSTTELISSIRSAVDGGSPMSPSVARKVIASFHDKQQAETSILTERESEILQQLAEGKSYHAIAKSIFLSVDGVSYHVRNIYQKLQVTSRGEAVREGLKKRLIKMFR